MRGADPLRRSDHKARTLVQMGVAIASISLALFLFQKQTEQQDGRLRRQQIDAASSVLRSLATSADEIAYRLPKLHTFDKCPICDQPDWFEQQAPYLDGLGRGDTVIPRLKNTPNDLRLLLRDNPAFSEELFNFANASIRAYEMKSTDLTEEELTLSRAYREEQSKHDSGKIPGTVVSEYFTKLVTIQTSGAEAAITFICRVVTVMRRLNGIDEGRLSRPPLVMVDNGIACPPYDVSTQELLRK